MEGGTPLDGVCLLRRGLAHHGARAVHGVRRELCDRVRAPPRAAGPDGLGRARGGGADEAAADYLRHLRPGALFARHRRHHHGLDQDGHLGRLRDGRLWRLLHRPHPQTPGDEAHVPHTAGAHGTGRRPPLLRDLRGRRFAPGGWLRRLGRGACSVPARAAAPGSARLYDWAASRIAHGLHPAAHHRAGVFTQRCWRPTSSFAAHRPCLRRLVVGGQGPAIVTTHRLSELVAPEWKRGGIAVVLQDAHEGKWGSARVCVRTRVLCG
mmetsp:Transcript_18458/g.60390  ORF Transcript_18458/g.60390 Transcript_18458/m.60390 type:complete len:266 (+) Transcript_18458:226-1023(+)